MLLLCIMFLIEQVCIVYMQNCNFFLIFEMMFFIYRCYVFVFIIVKVIVVYKKNQLMKVIFDMICLNFRGKGEKINYKVKKKIFVLCFFF